MEIGQIKHNFAKNLIELRKSKNWNQNALGEKLHYSFKNISKWEHEETFPDIEVLSKIAELFNVTIDDLISDKNLVKKSNKKRNRIIISICAILLPYILALITFFVLKFNQIENNYYSFLFGAIVSAITFIVLSSCWYKKSLLCTSIIYLIWSVILFLIFLFSFKLFWMLLIIGGVFTILLISFFNIKFHSEN